MVKIKDKEYRLTQLGVVFILLIVLIGGLFIYVMNQPKQVEYIYKQIQDFFVVPSQPDKPVIHR